MCEKPRDIDWGNLRNDHDYAEDKITVSITLAEYRELVGKAALYDESERAAREVADMVRGEGWPYEE